MKVKFTAVVIALLLGGGSLFGNRSSASPEPPQQTRQTLTVTKHGTLLRLLKTDGSTLTLSSDGFSLKYKSGNFVRSVFAKGSSTHGLRTSSVQVKHKENTATAVAQTADGALEITSEFSFDESTGTLAIKRKFRNTSNHPVDLQVIRNHLDPTLLKRLPARKTVQAGLPTNPDCVSALSDLSRVSLSSLSNFRCVPPPVCPWDPPCPPNFSYRSAQWDHPRVKNTVRWSDGSTPITLLPQRNGSNEDEAFIVVFI